MPTNRASYQVDSNDGKPVCLIVFKFKSPWNSHLIRKFSISFTVHHVFADDVFRKGGSSALISHLNQIVEKVDAEIIVFDIDFYPPLDLELIRNVAPKRKRIAVTFDDILLHDINAITASACRLVLSADPLSVFRYREKNFDAEFMLLEGSAEIYHDCMVPRDIDVLHFGVLGKADRKEFVDYLQSRGIKVTLLGEGRDFVPVDKLAEYISRAKIVVNFSKTNYLNTLDIGVSFAHPYYLQAKGRVIEAGFCGAACVSERAPALELLFTEGEVPFFRTREECYALVSRLLTNDAERAGYAQRLHRKVAAEFEDGIHMKRLAKVIHDLDIQGEMPVRVPIDYWQYVLKGKLMRLRPKPRLLVNEVFHSIIKTDAIQFQQKCLLLLRASGWILIKLMGKLTSRLAKGR